MATDLVWAVIDGPDGQQPVSMPPDRAAALRLKLQHDERFWCGRQASGCGSRLFVIAGEERRPHFRHEAHAACRFIDRPGAAEHSYEHLQYQLALQAWLHAQGHQADLEKHLGSDGRTDLHVVVDAVAHAIEVQLSPLGASAWQGRDQRYRQHAAHVAWLYGPGAGAAAATHLAARGVVLRLRPGPEVGVQDVRGQVRWAPLALCSLLPTGFVAPGLADALALHEQLLREQEEARLAAAERAAVEAAVAEQERQRRLAAERRRREEAQRARHAWEEQEAHRRRALPAVRAPGRAGPRTLVEWQRVYPEAAGWSPPGGWGWLRDVRDELHPAARALAYMTQVLLGAGPTASLGAGLLDDTDREELVRNMERHGLIVLDVALPSGPVGWSRADQIRHGEVEG